MSETVAADPADLASLAADCAALGIRRRVLLVRLPSHLAQPSRPAARRMLMDELAPFAAADRARLYRLPGGRLAAAWREGGRDGGQLLERAAERLRLLLEADAEGLPDAMAGEVRLCRLPEEVRVVQAFLDAANSAGLAAAPPPGRPLDVPELAALEAALAQADVARFVRRRRIYLAGPGGLVLHREHRVLDLKELAISLAPGRDLSADPWLLRRLCRTLDRRMLALLSDPSEVRGAGPFIVDLLVASLQEAAFARFDGALPPRLRGAVMLRFSAADVIAAPKQALAAVEAARLRRYQTMLAGGGALLSPARLGIDLGEVVWSDDLSPLQGHQLVSGLTSRGALEQAVGLGYRLLEGPAVESAARAA